MNFKEYRRLKETEELKEEGEAVPTNNTDADNFATYARPMFIEKRFGRMKEYVIPREQYAKMKLGRTLGDRWLNYVEDPELQGSIRKTYHDDEEFLLTCSETGVSSIVQKIARQHRIQRQMTASSGDDV